MGFNKRQTRQLTAPLKAEYVRTRDEEGLMLHYLEGWHVMNQANHVFGFDGWDRETLTLEPLQVSFAEPEWHAAYQARVRITVWSSDGPVTRDGTGVGHGCHRVQAKAKDAALKAAETDATKRALATFGNRFGLCLYDRTLTHIDGVIQDGYTTAPWALVGLNGSRVGVFHKASDFCGALRRMLQTTNELGLLARAWALNFAELARLTRETPDLKNQAGMHYAEILRHTYERKLETLLAPATETLRRDVDQKARATPKDASSGETSDTGASRDGRIDKSQLPIGAPARRRDKDHLRYVASLSCLICGRRPCQAHHITYAQRRGLGQKVSDEFTVPLCTIHHRQLHDHGNERTWWATHAIEPLVVAAQLWAHDSICDAAVGKSVDAQQDETAPLKAGVQQS